MTKYYTQLIAVNKDHYLLFQHRSSDAKNNPNKWDLFGGGMEEGETPEVALRRELIEELELSVISLKFYKEKTLVEDGITKRRFYFLGEINDSKEGLNKKQHEGQGLDFIPPEKVKDVDLVLAHREVVDLFIEELKSNSNIIH